MQQVQKTKTSSKTEAPEVEELAPSEAADLSVTDDLLDEIDEVLERNAEEFVKAYIQKGGE